MVKIRLLTGLTAAGAAAFAAHSLAGCASPQDDGAATGGDQADTSSVAGSGAITLHSYDLSYASTSGGDEFLRVGERMKLAVGLDDVTELMYLGDANDQTVIAAVKADPSALKLTLKMTYTKFDGSTVAGADTPMTFAPGAGGVLAASSPEFVIPNAVKTLHAELQADAKVGAVTYSRALLSSHGIPSDFTVFGAFLPNKLALFDTNGSNMRTRIVEGGAIVKGSQVTLSYTDYRLDTMVDKTKLDLRVGSQYSGSRFGPMIVDALGALDYVVGAVVSTDGGATFTPIALDKITGAEIFSRSDSYYRFAMQALSNIPSSAGANVQIAFHIQAYLVVPNYYPGQIMNAKYAPGQRILLKDVWDNNGGANYSLPVGND